MNKAKIYNSKVFIKNIKNGLNCVNKNIKSYLKLLKLFVFLLIIENTRVFNIITIFTFILNKFHELRVRIFLKEYINSIIIHTNIDLNEKFFVVPYVAEQIMKKNLSYIETIYGGKGNVGNALIMLNNLINICENIRCNNIIAPDGLENIIQNKIYDNDYNLTILPNRYKDIIKVDIDLNNDIAFHFNYKKKHQMRLSIIRDEVFNNVPKYIANPNDLYINIRSGDIFTIAINIHYSQPPLCFYQKILNENKFNNTFILSNGHENPIVDELLKLYSKIKYLHGSIEEDISVIINAFNFVMPSSTFPITLIYLNNNLKNLYIYEIIDYKLKNVKYIIHKMLPSIRYIKIMKRKWRMSKKQLNLMMNEKCQNDSIITIPFENSNDIIHS